MKLRGFVIAFIASVLLPLGMAAQEMKSEISVQGTGLFTKDSDGNGIRNQATNTGGFMVGYRYNFNRWLGGEAAYGYARNTQIFSGFVPARVESNVHQITSAAVVKLPGFYHLVLPYVLGGGGVLAFDPTHNPGGAFAGASEQTQGTFLYGAGADFVLRKHVSLRVEYRGFVYKAADFNVPGLKTDAWTHIAQPSAGFAFHF